MLCELVLQDLCMVLHKNRYKFYDHTLATSFRTYVHDPRDIDRLRYHKIDPLIQTWYKKYYEILKMCNIINYK